MLLTKVNPQKCNHCYECQCILPQLKHGPVEISDNVRDEELRLAAYRAEDNCSAGAITVFTER